MGWEELSLQSDFHFLKLPSNLFGLPNDQKSSRHFELLLVLKTHNIIRERASHIINIPMMHYHIYENESFVSFLVPALPLPVGGKGSDAHNSMF